MYTCIKKLKGKIKIERELHVANYRPGEVLFQFLFSLSISIIFIIHVHMYKEIERENKN